ncbi:MAG: hypothetical protein ACRESU_01735, partial [Gammaproteobacteria bacterium]
LAMDADNLLHLQKLRRASSHAELVLLLDYAQHETLRSVPDPYNGGPAGFDRVLDLVEQGVVGLLRSLCERQGIEFSATELEQQKARH